MERSNGPPPTAVQVEEVAKLTKVEMRAEENNNARRVCIIGAGISGLPAIKACLEEGLQPVCFEMTSEIGGLWNYRELGEKHSTVMRSTIVNTSKEMMAYSDFPPDEDLPNFMHNTKVQEYLLDYMHAFKLGEHIRLSSKVECVEETVDHGETGQWRVTSDTHGEEVFDAVMLCTGHHSEPHMPTFKGMEKFKGKIMHSQQYKHSEGLEDKHAVVVGIGNSALDCAVELTRCSKSVHISTRRGAWLWRRVGDYGLPYDVYLLTRQFRWILGNISTRVTSNWVEHKANRQFDHERYGLLPDHRFFQQHPSVNDSLPNLCITGQLTIKGDIKEFKEESIVFEDDVEVPCDLAVLATGYTYGYPFLRPQSLVPVDGNFVDLYKWVFPMHQEKQTMAVIGLIQPYGSVSPLSELQCRYAARVFAGNMKLPSKAEQWDDLNKVRAKMAARYVKSQRHTVQVDYLEYSHELAEIIGANPPLLKMFFTDFTFWHQCFFGPLLPYQYRLRGPSSWSGARQAIMDSTRRIWAPLHQRKCPPRRYKNLSPVELVRKLCARFFIQMIFCAIFFGVYVGLSFALNANNAVLYFLWTSVLCISLMVSIYMWDLSWDITTLI